VAAFVFGGFGNGSIERGREKKGRKKKKTPFSSKIQEEAKSETLTPVRRRRRRAEDLEQPWTQRHRQRRGPSCLRVLETAGGRRKKEEEREAL
jgi:hypothetical protein